MAFSPVAVMIGSMIASYGIDKVIEILGMRKNNALQEKMFQYQMDYQKASAKAKQEADAKVTKLMQAFNEKTEARRNLVQDRDYGLAKEQLGLSREQMAESSKLSYADMALRKELGAEQNQIAREQMASNSELGKMGIASDMAKSTQSDMSQYNVIANLLSMGLM